MTDAFMNKHMAREIMISLQGGGIYQFSGFLSLTKCTFNDNKKDSVLDDIHVRGERFLLTDVNSFSGRVFGGDGSTLLLSDPFLSSTGNWEVSSKVLVLKGCPIGMSGYQNFVSSWSDLAATTWPKDETPTSLCHYCAAGKFANTGAKTSCELCGPGEKSEIASGSLRCILCEMGRYSLGGMSSCDGVCTRGSYQDQEGQTSCKPCSAGKYGKDSSELYTFEANSCTNCSIGKYSEAKGISSESGCNACPAGTSSETPGLDSRDKCTPTAKGKYNDGQECSKGTYQDEKGQTSCKPCPAGKYGKDSTELYTSEANSCINCTEGKYSSAKGISSDGGCNACPAGRAGATAGLDSSAKCTPTAAGKYNNGEACLQGTFQDQVGQTSCKPCPAGKYGKASSALYTSEANSCDDCVLGKYSSAKGIATESGCNSCPAGRTGLRSGLSDRRYCTPSPSGMYSDGTSTRACNPGTYQDQEGQTSCKLCQAGRYGNGYKLRSNACSGTCPAGTHSFAGQPACSACDIGKYSREGSESCSYCPQYQTTLGEGARECVCNPGMVMAYGACRYCSDMAQGLVCTAKGLDLHSLPTEAGFFRANVTSNSTYPCLSGHWVSNREHADCVGGNVTNQCRPHHGGMLCMVCDEGYVRHGAGIQTCSACTLDSAAAAGIYTGVAIGILVASVAFIYGIVRYLLKDTGISTDKEASSSSSEGSRQISSATYQETAMSSAQNNLQVVSKLKIIVGWGQVTSSVDSTFSVPWPSTFRNMMDVLRSICNMDFVGFFAGFGCLFSNSFAVKFWVHMMTLPVLLTLIGISWSVAQRRVAAEDRKTMKDRLVKITALLTFLMYPGLGMTIFSVWKCMSIEGELYFVEDFSQVCFQGKHLVLTTFAVLFLILYIVGMPAMLWWRLYTHRNEIKQRFDRPIDPHVEARFGHLFMPYEPGFWYGELIEMAKKLMLTAGLSMFAKDSVIQLLLGILICFAHFGYMTKKQPFVDRLDDVLSQCAGIQIFLTLQIGLVLKVGQSNDQGIVDVVLVGLTLVVLGFGIFCLASVFHKPKVVDRCLMSLYGRVRRAKRRRAGKDTSKGNVEMQVVVQNPVNMVGRMGQSMQFDGGGKR